MYLEKPKHLIIWNKGVSIIRFIMDYIFIVCIFGAINLDTLLYKHAQT
jgi:hypothetical protein